MGIKILHTIQILEEKILSEIYDTGESMFPINLNNIDQYQQNYPRLMAKIKTGKYKCSSFCGGRNNNFNLLMYEENFYSVKTQKMHCKLVSCVFTSSSGTG